MTIYMRFTQCYYRGFLQISYQKFWRWCWNLTWTSDHGLPERMVSNVSTYLYFRCHKWNWPASAFCKFCMAARISSKTISGSFHLDLLSLSNIWRWFHLELGKHWLSCHSFIVSLDFHTWKKWKGNNYFTKQNNRLEIPTFSSALDGAT